MKLKADAVRAAIQGALGGHEPTEEQEAAITAPLEHGVINAGAGSGKTAVMTARVVHLVATEQVRPAQVLGLTFTNRAADQLRERIRRALSDLGFPLGEEPTVDTYHGFASGLIEEHGLRIGVEAGALLTPAQIWQLCWEVLGAGSYEHLEIRSKHHASSVSDLASECADHLVDPSQIRDADAFLLARLERAGKLRVQDQKIVDTLRRRMELSTVVDRYRAVKDARGVLDFGDQILRAADLAAVPEVVETFRSRYRVVLLDEYQDTNIAQAMVLQRLASEGGPAMTAVGDPWQNIYAWRGASLRNILRFHEEFPRPDGGPATRFDLRTNFRSGSRIIEAANGVLVEATEPGEAPRELRPRADAPEGVVEGFVVSDQLDETSRIASMCRAEIDAGTPPDEIAILVRKRRIFAPLIRALREADVPVEVVGLGGLLSAPEVVDVISFVRAATDPDDSISLARILTGPRWRIGFRDLATLAREALDRNRELRDQGREDEQVEFSLSETIERVEAIPGVSEVARTRLLRFRESLRRLRDGHRTLADMLEAAIDELGILREVDASPLRSAMTIRRNLANLVEQASAFRPIDGSATVNAFLEWLDAAGESGEDLNLAQPSNEPSVKLMTVHQAKGLEFDVVFVAAIAGASRSQIFPDTRQSNPIQNPSKLPYELRGDHDVLPTYQGDLTQFRNAIKERVLREERRLLFVAMTRARRRLVCSAAWWYLPSGKLDSMKDPIGPSEFLEALLDDPAVTVLERVEQPDHDTLADKRGELATKWPRPARRAHAAFPDGAAAAVRGGRAIAIPDQGLFPLDPESVEPRAPKTLSVTAIATHADCPQRFYWTFVRPLPRRFSPAARIGTEVHAWIAERHEPQLVLLEPEDLEPTGGQPGRAATLRSAFRSSRFADLAPYRVEHPFALMVGPHIIQGRIDAMFQEDGVLEIVDWKTGRAPVSLGSERWQMELYALAAQRILGTDADRIRLTLVYLGGDEVTEVDVPARAAETIEADLRERLDAIAAGLFEPTPSSHCRTCDFLHVCDAGRAQMAASAAST